MVTKQTILILRTFLILVFLLFCITARVEAVKADTLVIQDDGRIILILGPYNVLSESTDRDKQEPTFTTSASPKTVPLVSSKVKSVVKITPPTSDNKKIDVTITARPPTPTVTKTVDRVVAEDQKGQAVLDIKSTGKNNLIISQGTSDVQTNLPVQINTNARSINVITPAGEKKVSVLPAVVVDNLTTKGVIGTKPVVSLVQEKGEVLYKIQSENKGKLLGLVEVKWPVEVKVSAQTGKTVNVKQPILANLFRLFIR